MTEKEEGEILALIRTLFRQFEKAEETKQFPVFSPLRAWINANGRVQFEIADTTDDIAFSLKSIGVTIYHLIMGESEVTKESYRVDGYRRRPLRSECWPVIEYMLSGRATDASIIKKRLGWKRRFNDWCAKKSNSIKQAILAWAQRKKKAMVLGAAIQAKQKEPARVVFNEPVNPVRRDIFTERRKQGVAKVKISGQVFLKCLFFALSLGMGLTASFLFIIYINEASSLGRGTSLIVGFFSLLFMSPILYVFFGMRLNLQTAIINFVINIFFSTVILFLIAVVIRGEPGDRRSMILRVRATGEFIGRLTEDKDDELARFDGAIINPFKYRIERGLALKGTMKKVYNLSWQGQEKKLPVEIEYRLDVVNKSEYVRALSAWRNQERLEKEILAFFDGFDRWMNDYWRILNNENKDGAQDDYNQAMMQVKIMDFLRRKVHERGLACDEPLKTQLVCKSVDNVESCAEALMPAERIALWKTYCEHPEKRDIPFVQIIIR